MSSNADAQPVSAPEAAPKRDYRQEVTNQIIEMLEKGTAPWQKPWQPDSRALPFNPTTDHAYRGGNAIHLMATAARRGFSDPRWLTYRQAQAEGWQVRQGEKGTQIEYWQFDDGSKGKDGQPGKPNEGGDHDPAAAQKRPPIHRVYTVFNAQQMDSVPAYEKRPRPQWEVVQTGESIVANSGAKITHDQHDRAFYNRASDAIHLPDKSAFAGAPQYYGTAMHELAHWSGHPSRLNRPTLNESYRFGDPNYAKEELRAELTSVFLAAERGIPHDPGQHAAYVNSWISVLKDDKHEIFRAAKDAHAAADFLLSLERAKSMEQPAPEVPRAETSEHVAALDKKTGTVNIVEKETATEHRYPVRTGAKGEADRNADAKLQTEKILDGEVDGRRPPSESDVQKSLTEAKQQTRQRIGAASKLFEADADSGKYCGVICGETSHHVLQQISARSVIAHRKDLLPAGLTNNSPVAINYSNLQADVRPHRLREKGHALAR